MAATLFSWASMTPATNCWPPFRALASGRGVVVAVAVVSVRVVRAAAGLRDFEAVRVLRDFVVERVLRDFVVDLAFVRDAGLRLGVDFGELVDFEALAVFAELAGFGVSAGLVSVFVSFLVAVSVAMLAPLVSVCGC
jgi:hypothetical protein